jgi:hypothetical protein
MAYKPNGEPILDEKRLKVISEYEDKIDETLKGKRGKDDCSVVVKYSWDHSGHHSGDTWLWEELVQRYKNVGWKFVTVYLSAEYHALNLLTDGEFAYDKRTQDLYIYVSLERPLKNSFSNMKRLGQLSNYLRKERYLYVCGDKIA